MPPRARGGRRGRAGGRPPSPGPRGRASPGWGRGQGGIPTPPRGRFPSPPRGRFPSPPRGQFPSPPRPSPPPAPPSPPPPPPPAAVDEKKKAFQDLLAKKSAEWDRMMQGQRPEDRTHGFEEFRRLSDEEVDLANRLVSKSKLNDFVGLKIQYFDQLATERDARNRSEGIKRFQEVCDKELALAKAVGPRHLLRGEAEVDARLAKEREEEEESKRRRAQEEKADDRKRKGLGGLYPVGYVMPAHRMPLAFGPRMWPGMRRGSMTDMRTGTGPESYAAAMHRMFTMEQRMDPQTGMLEAGMHDVIPPLDYANSGMGGPYDFAATQQGMPQNVQTPPVSDIDQKLRLLAQLEAARAVLNNHPTSSSASSSDEVRSRLRRINRLQMKVIDEILGSKADLSTDIMSDLQDQRARFDDEGSRERPKGKHSREPRKIILELPDTDDAEAHIITGSPSRFDSSYTPMCTGTSDLCPVRLGGYSYLDCEPETVCVTTTYERQTIYPDDMPHYHGEREPLPGPSNMHYQPEYSTYTVLVPEFFPQGPCLSPKREWDGDLAEVFQAQEYSDANLKTAPASDQPTFVARTTVIVNTREQATDTEGAIISPPLQPLEAVQGNPPSPLVPALTAASPLEQAGGKPTSTSAERFAKDCKDSLRKIADSVSGIHHTVSSYSLVSPQGRKLAAAALSLSEESSPSEPSQ